MYENCGIVDLTPPFEGSHGPSRTIRVQSEGVEAVMVYEAGVGVVSLDFKEIEDFTEKVDVFPFVDEDTFLVVD